MVGDIETVINKNALITDENENAMSVLSKYKPGDKVNAIVVDCNPSQNKLILSVRDAVLKERKDEYEKYMATSTEEEGSYTLADILSKKDEE